MKKILPQKCINVLCGKKKKKKKITVFIKFNTLLDDQSEIVTQYYKNFCSQLYFILNKSLPQI